MDLNLELHVSIPETRNQDTGEEGGTVFPELGGHKNLVNYIICGHVPETVWIEQEQITIFRDLAAKC